MIRHKDLEDWLYSPVTIEFLDLLKEHRNASKEEITNCMLRVNDPESVNLQKVSQYKWQFHTLDLIIDIENFLKERIEQNGKSIQTINE